jgi:hypothetical protein
MVVYFNKIDLAFFSIFETKTENLSKNVGIGALTRVTGVSVTISSVIVILALPPMNELRGEVNSMNG